MLNYDEFLNETKMSPEKSGKDLELNKKGKLLPPFMYYYQDELDDNFYFVFKFINRDEYQPDGNKVTLLYNSLWQDTDNPNRMNQIITDTDFSDDEYYFYELVSTPRRIREIHGVNVPLDKEPGRFDTQLTFDNRKHFIVIKKKSSVTNVRLNSGQRSSHGIDAEEIISKKFTWKKERTSINKKIVSNNIITDFTDVLKTHMGVLNNDGDLFNLLDPDSPLNKNDLVITGGIHDGEKIEVKKYNVTNMFYKDKRSKPLMMAEQYKIATKGGLRKLVRLYKEMNPDVDVEPLIGDFNEDGGVKLNILFRKTEDDIPEDLIELRNEHRELMQNIRNFYNERIDYMVRKFQMIPEDSIMDKIFGIYFFNNKNGVDGFLIKTDNPKKEKNINYYWDKVESQWGLNRIKLLFKVKPKAFRYVWLGDESVFVKTFEVSDKEKLKELQKTDDETHHNPIIKNTDMGPIKWDSTKGYWISIDENDPIVIGGVVMNLDNYPSKNTNQTNSI